MFTREAKALSLGTIILLSGTFVSCDKEYDLSKNVNTDMTIGSNFTVPVGKTSSILLSRIIKESSTIVNVNGIYEVTTNGSTSSTIHLADVPVNITPYFQNVDIDMPSTIAKRTLLKSTDVSLPDVSQSTTYDIDVQLPEEVESLYKATLNVNTILELSFSSLPTEIESITLSNLKINYPEIVTLNDGTHSFNHNEIVLTKNHLKETLYINIASLDIAENNQSKYIYTKNGHRYLKIKDALTISANIKAAVNGIPSVSRLSLAFSYTPENSQVLIGNVAGVFNTTNTANINQTIELEDIPDFLKNGDSSFTPEEVSFLLDLNNPTDIPWNINLDLSSIKKQNTKTANVDFTVNTGMNLLNISNVNSYSERSFQPCPEITDLFGFVPEKFNVESKKILLKSENANQTIQLGSDYSIKADYNVVIPFRFKNLYIEYADSVTNLLSDLKDISDKTDKLVVTATGLSTIPAALSASVKLYDISGNELTGILVDVSKFQFTAAPVSGEESTSPLEITLTEADGSTDLERLEKIVYTINGTSSLDGTTLRPTQHIIIKDIKAKIPEGINLTL